MKKNAVSKRLAAGCLCFLLYAAVVTGSCAVAPQYRFSDGTRSPAEVSEIRAAGCVRTFRVGPMNELARWRDRYAIKPGIATVVIAECPLSELDIKRFRQARKTRVESLNYYGTRTAFTLTTQLLFVPEAGHRYALNVELDFSYLDKERLVDTRLTDVTDPQSPVEVQTRAPVLKEVW